ncbi:MAG: hypothetical protein Q9191_002099 [Dirinaria sp. TL-2023a]
MASLIPPPNLQHLLPPLLACLPTGTASPRPPPALLPLLSPILQQRVQLLSATAETPTESWLPLLCWDQGPAQKLCSVVASEAFELHPVSGEIEFDELEPAQYRKLDEETLQAEAIVHDLGLVVVYVWCHGDQEGTADGWKVSEVSPIDPKSEHMTGDWWPSIGMAHERAGYGTQSRQAQHNSGVNGEMVNGTSSEEVKGDDDDYWARYDRTPGRTPAIDRPPRLGGDDSPASEGNAAEAAYFDQYSQVQPEMDNDDPSQDRETVGASSLNGNILGSINEARAGGTQPEGLAATMPLQPTALQAPDAGTIRPSTGSSSTYMEGMPSEEDSAKPQTNAELAIRQHVSTSVKSLFRLCRSAGIDRPEFEELIQTELQTLSMLSEDD